MLMDDERILWRLELSLATTNQRSKGRKAVIITYTQLYAKTQGKSDLGLAQVMLLN